MSMLVLPILDPCMVYFPTLTININQTWVNIPYMDPVGYEDFFNDSSRAPEAVEKGEHIYHGKGAIVATCFWSGPIQSLFNRDAYNGLWKNPLYTLSNQDTFHCSIVFLEGKQQFSAWCCQCFSSKSPLNCIMTSSLWLDIHSPKINMKPETSGFQEKKLLCQDGIFRWTMLTFWEGTSLRGDWDLYSLILKQENSWICWNNMIIFSSHRA